MSNPTTERAYRQRIAEELETPVEEANALAQRLGLDPFPVNYWIVDYDEMNELIAYGGFQHRYPHWRWGMQYDRQQKQGQFLGGKAFEIVNNDDPSQAFLQESNELADQKAVITHVEAHADFFKNNEWFKLFDESPDAAAMLEGHAETVSEYMDDPEIDREAVEAWIDHVLCLEDNIDQHQPFRTAENWIGESAELEDAADRLGELRLSDEVRDQVFSEAWLDAQEEDPAPVSAPEEPQKDILAFLSTHGMRYDGETGKAVEFEQWQRELLEILRKESYYFAPQRMTKVMNEGWACVTPETLVQSPAGLVPMEEIVETHAPVSDGDSPRAVYDSHIIEDEPTISIETEHGFRLEGSERHRVRSAEGTWVSLAELAVGDGVQLAGGQELWPSEPVTVDWGATSGPANATETGQRARTAGPSRLPWVGTDDGRRVSLYELLGYAIGVVFLVFFGLLILGGASQAVLLELFVALVAVNAVLAGGLAKVAGAHWSSALAAGAFGWLTSLFPLLAAGWFAGYVELRYISVNVGDIATLNEILGDEEAPIADLLGRMRAVPLFRLILIVALTNVGSAVASYVVFPALLPYVAADIGGMAGVTNLLWDGINRGTDIVVGVV